MPAPFFANSPDARVTHRVIAFVCCVIISGAWSFALVQSARIDHWQWYTLGGLTVLTLAIFYRWLKRGRLSRFGAFCAGLAIVLMLLITL